MKSEKDKLIGELNAEIDAPMAGEAKLTPSKEPIEALTNIIDILSLLQRHHQIRVLQTVAAFFDLEEEL